MIVAADYITDSLFVNPDNPSSATSVTPSVATVTPSVATSTPHNPCAILR